jgi:Fe-S-cluster containining protein
LDISEAGRIACELNLSLAEFLKKYADKRWPGTQSFLLRKRHRACVFLKRMPDGKQAICLIHPFRPLSCREWTAGWHQHECQAGLAKYWGLTVEPSGEIQGAARRIKSFECFLESLV